MHKKSTQLFNYANASISEKYTTIIWLITSVAYLLMVRLPNLQYEVINWDESTFIISSADILKGHLPYIYTLDNKPPVLYFTIAIALWLWKSVISVRLLGALFVWGTSLFVFLIIRKNYGIKFAFVLSLLFIALMDAPYAQHTSSEVIAILYLIAAIWALINFDSIVMSFVSGVLMSLAILVRTNLIITAFAGGIYLLTLFLKDKKRLNLARGMLYILGGIIPPILIYAIYALNGQADYFKLGLITIPMSYSAARISMLGVFLRLGYLWLKYCLSNPGVAVPVSLTTILLLTDITVQIKRKKWYANCKQFLRSIWAEMDESALKNLLLVLCFATTFISILVSGGVYAHYLIQLFPFVAILLAFLMSRIEQGKIKRLAFALSVLAIITTFYRLPDTVYVLTNFSQLEKDYKGRKIAATLEGQLSESDEIWAIEYHITLLYLDKNPIIPLVTHPSNLGKASYKTALSKFDPQMRDPFELILAKAPKVILSSPNISDGSMTEDQNKFLLEYVEKYYTLKSEVDQIKVFIRKGS